MSSIKTNTGHQENEKQIEKRKVSKAELFDHIRESCVKDPFYLTKILVTVVGKHAGMLLIRIGIYILIVFPFFTNVLEFSRTTSAIAVILLIIGYYSLRGIYDKLTTEVKNGSG
jgi:hypothetical protein